MKKIATIVGARPQFIKAAVVSRAIQKYNQAENNGRKIKEVIIHTGQHYDSNMSAVFFDEMKIPAPDHFLNINSLSHGAMTGQMLEKIEGLLQNELPDMVMVYGDTNTTLAGALAAAKLHVPAAHVESGLRSFNRLMPEEINRVITDHVCNLLFCPTNQAVENLRREGIGRKEYQPVEKQNADKGAVRSDADSSKLAISGKLVRKPWQIQQVGDVMLDAALYYKKFAVKPKFQLPSRYALATVHRAENTDDLARLRSIFTALGEISQKIPIFLPLHPRTKTALKASGLDPGGTGLQMVEPLGYLNMLYLLAGCSLVITDSGGLQKEAFFFQKPCITLREETEWTELVENGFNTVAGTSRVGIHTAYEKMTAVDLNFNVALYGDGRAGEKIVEAILRFF